MGYLPASWDVLWSLSVEESFYFVYPLIRRLTNGVALGLAGLALAIYLLW